ncbi:hypothetical protein F4803DRAFT_526261 [Xylaria telfairii]|nr:hypothetical protein F4803DRAFT_526261 [Xylaria telfairii]
MQLFDEASRRPWRSIIILTRAYSWPLVSIEACVSLLALAFDPFTQQVVAYPSRITPTSGPAAAVRGISSPNLLGERPRCRIYYCSANHSRRLMGPLIRSRRPTSRSLSNWELQMG